MGIFSNSQQKKEITKDDIIREINQLIITNNKNVEDIGELRNNLEKIENKLFNVETKLKDKIKTEKIVENTEKLIKIEEEKLKKLDERKKQDLELIKTKFQEAETMKKEVKELIEKHKLFIEKTEKTQREFNTQFVSYFKRLEEVEMLKSTSNIEEPKKPIGQKTQPEPKEEEPKETEEEIIRKETNKEMGRLLKKQNGGING